MTPSKHQFAGKCKRVKLSDICVKGKSSLRQKDIANDGPYAVYGASGIVGSTSCFQNAKPYVAVVKDGAGVGRANACNAETSVLGTMQALIPKEGVDCRYLLHLVRSMRLGEDFSGSTIPHIYFRDYGKTLVPFPDMSGQRQIVEALDDIEKQRLTATKQIDRLDSLVKSRFVEMFGNDKLFQARQMGQLFSGIVSGTNVSGKQRSILPGEFAVLKISAVTKGFFKPNEYKVVDDVSNIKMIHPRKGDLLFSRANTSEMVGATAIVDDDYEQLFLPDKLWRLDPAEGVNSLFLKYLLSTERVRAEISKASTGTSGSMQNISMAKFSRIDVFLPSAELQQQFADFAAQVDKSRFAGTFTGTINMKNYAISCSVHNNSGRIPNEALHSAREVTECALFELQELYDSLTQKYFAL